jgi:hypothetical protein
MNLYERDYLKLTDEDVEKWEAVREKGKFTEEGKKLPFGRRNLFRDLPKAIRHHKSLFPNNYLDFAELRKKQEVLHSQIDGFEELLCQDSTGESQILAYINSGNYHIAASIMRLYRFGHHGGFLFKEFPLGVSYRADYLLVGRASGGHQFIFVEFESNKGNVVIKDGNFGDVLRKGINQINDWKRWVSKNYPSLKEVFDKVRNKKYALPDEFYELDITRIHYVVVAGRRDDFNDEANYERRRTEKENGIKVLHYDNLIDVARNAIGENTY